MFKKLALSIVLCASLYLPLFAEEVKFEPVIYSQGTFSDEVAPDTARIKFYITNTGLNVSDIKEKNDKIVNDATTKIKAKLTNKEQIKTIAYSVRSVYSYKDKIRIFQKYEVKNGFEVKLKDLSKISEIIKIATDAGIKEVGQLNFALEDSEEVCNKMLAQSAKMAQKRALTIANALGEQLGKAKEINPSCSLDSSRVMRSKVYANSFGAMTDSVNASENTVIDVIEPGSLNVRSSVNITYYLK